MNRDIFIQYLSDLHQNRFALNSLSSQEFSGFRQALLACFDLPDSQDWYLLGTDGCHLCDHAYQSISQAKMMGNIPNVIRLDLVDGDAILIDTLGVMIPVLLTPTRLLCYPFGVMDIIALANKPSPSS